jgi:putative membrane-bound dehydrogenase-like protein
LNRNRSTLVHGFLPTWLQFLALTWAAPFLAGQDAAPSQAKPDYSAELPRIPALSPQDSMRSIRVPEGYRLELAAAEPEIRDPVAMSFDENGRMFVVEMCDYSEQETESLGAIRLLEDRDHDGRYETSTLFASNLSWPTGVLCYDGGIFVAAAPDIWFLKDTNGDGKSDIQTKVLSGFGRSNVQGLLNSFCWGIDNRIYCQVSSSGATVVHPSKPDVAPLNLNGRDFSFDPKTMQLRPESGGGQHGMSFDDFGRRFTCHNSDHLQMYLYDDQYITANSNVPLPPSRLSIAADGPQANVFRLSPVEPWRNVRTRLRVSNQAAGPIEGGGRAAGYFTSGTGVTIVRGNAFSDDLKGMAIIGDVGSNIVHRKRLSESGVAMVGERVDKESELIAATDIWFRPVQFANAPDGTLYIADLYREVIEHPKSLPEEIKKHLDLTSGRDRGRIYRLAPNGFKQPPAPELGQATIDQLIATLEHPNGWHRDTASRLLYERLADRRDVQVSPRSMDALDSVASSSAFPPARLHALGVLASIGEGQGRGVIQAALQDSHPRIREWAIRWNETTKDEPLTTALAALAQDPDPRVRLQLALSLNRFSLPESERVALALQLLALASDDRWLRAASLNAIGPNGLSAWKRLQSGQGRGGKSEVPLPVWQTIALLAGQQTSIDSWTELETILLSMDQETHQRQACIGLLKAMQQRIPDIAARTAALAKLPDLNAAYAKLISESRTRCLDPSLAIADRTEAIDIVSIEQSSEDIALLAGLLNQREPQPVQQAVTKALMQYPSSDVATVLLDAWPSLSPRMRSLASDVLFSRAAWIEMLLGRAGQGGFAINELEPAKIASLRNHPNASVQKLADSVLKAQPASNRQEVLTKYRAALTMPGNTERGKQAFAKVCAACHRLDGVGYELAPSLASYQFRGSEAILQNVIEPNREVNPQYLSYTIITVDERIVTGMILEETATSVTLVRGENQSETVDRSNIAEIKSSKVSLMPEGIETQLELQGMADLLSYLQSNIGSAR